MADLSDVMSKIADLATTACYPNGTSSTSVTTRRIYIMQGWPKPQDMDQAMTGNYAIVNIYAIQGSTSNAPQVFSKPQIITPAVTGLSASIDDATGTIVTLSGTPQVGEYVTLVIDKRAYSYVYAAGNTAADFAAGLVALIIADYPLARSDGSSLTVPGSHSIVVRIAAPTTLGRTIHRQTQQIRVVVWANNPTDRNIVSAAIDVFLKQNLTISFADTSEAIVNYQGTYLDDNLQNTGEWRRDIIFTVTYATVEQFPGYAITSVGLSYSVTTISPAAAINPAAHLPVGTSVPPPAGFYGAYGSGTFALRGNAAGMATATVLINPLSFGSDLVGWWHADDATAASWADRGPNGYTMLQPTSANRPAVSSTSFMGKSGVALDGAATFMKAAGVALGTDKVTVYAFAQQTLSANVNQRLIAYEGNGVGDDFTGPGSAVLIGSDAVSDAIESYRSGLLSHVELLSTDETVPTPGAFYRIGAEWDGSNNTIYVDGKAATPVADTQGALASVGNLRIGSFMDGTSAFWQGVVREFIVVKNTITSARRQMLLDHLARDWTRVLVVEGDSIAYAPQANGGWSYQYLPNASPPVLLQNVAIGGSRLDTNGPLGINPGDLTYRATTNVDNRIPANKWGKQYVLMIVIGANDLTVYQGLDEIAGPAQYAANIGAYCLARKAAGYDKIVLATVMSRTDSNYADIDAYRHPYNNIIRDPSWQAAHGVDAIADWAADSIMGVDQAPTVNPTYFVDAVHPSPAGNTRLEAIVRATINSL